MRTQERRGKQSHKPQQKKKYHAPPPSNEVSPIWVIGGIIAAIVFGYNLVLFVAAAGDTFLWLCAGVVLSAVFIGKMILKAHDD